MELQIARIAWIKKFGFAVLCLVSFLSSISSSIADNLLEPVPQVLAQMTPQNRQLQQQSCEETHFILPDDYYVYAVSRLSGQKLPFQLSIQEKIFNDYFVNQFYDNTHEAHVYVNETKKPVILMLNSGNTVWQIHQTLGTHIAAIFIRTQVSSIRGYYAGDPPEYYETADFFETIFYPLESVVYIVGLNDTTQVQVCRDRKNGSYDFLKPEAMNSVALRLFNRPVNKVFTGSDGITFVGQPQDFEQYTQYWKSSAEVFRYPDTWFNGYAGLEEAIRAGVMRPGNRADLLGWMLDSVVNSYLTKAQCSEFV